MIINKIKSKDTGKETTSPLIYKLFPLTNGSLSHGNGNSTIPINPKPR